MAIAKRTGRRVGLDAATLMGTDADMAAVPDVAWVRWTGQPSEVIDPLDELSMTIARAERRNR